MRYFERERLRERQVKALRESRSTIFGVVDALAYNLHALQLLAAFAANTIHARRDRTGDTLRDRNRSVEMYQSECEVLRPLDKYS